ncbi:hypothetical protein CDD83_3905 [Cordyceps sp. RAO-2017]|nr:hypothetical protein CDD83_3905 [Cordyceps sp. RAO-2017]
MRRDGPPAYDVAVLEACRDRGLRCWSANPELFHHAYGPSIIGGMDGSEGIPPVDVAGRDQADRRGETPNIDCGFADGAFDFDDADADRLRWLRREVGRRGRCLKEGRLPSSA